MAAPATSPDPTTVPLDQQQAGAGDRHVDSLKKAYDKAAVEVNQTPPNTPEYFRAREAKKAAFQKYKGAADAKVEYDAVVATAEQKQAAAESAARDAQAAKKAAAAATRQPTAARSTTAAASAAGESDADVSPLSAENAGDAIDQISRMRSRDRLQQVVDSDSRATVKAAAQKRLGEL